MKATLISLNAIFSAVRSGTSVSTLASVRYTMQIKITNEEQGNTKVNVVYDSNSQNIWPVIEVRVAGRHSLWF